MAGFQVGALARRCYMPRMTLLQFVLAACLLLIPGRDHSRLATAISARVEVSDPLFRDDPAKLRTAALMVAVAYREGGLRPGVVGDHGASFCTFQVHRSAGGTPALVDDVDACVAMGFGLLRTSLQACPDFPIAWYAEGPRGCDSARAQRISRDRMAVAAYVVRVVRQ